MQFCKDQLLNHFSSWCSYLEFVLLHQCKLLQTANYADHTIPYITGMAIGDIIPSPKSSLNILLNWFEDYHMKSNCDKSRLSGWDLVVTANTNVNIISYIKSEKAQCYKRLQADFWWTRFSKLIRKSVLWLAFPLFI